MPDEHEAPRTEPETEAVASEPAAPQPPSADAPEAANAPADAEHVAEGAADTAPDPAPASQAPTPTAASSGGAALDGEALRAAVIELAGAEPLYAAMMADERLRETLLEEISLVPLPREAAQLLARARDEQPELWRHLLRSALLAAWLVARRGSARHDMRMVAAAGLFHDLGMLRLDPSLLAPDEAIDSAQQRQLDSHPLVAARMLEGDHQVPRQVLLAILEHHELMDGSGYPRALQGEAISPWGRVLGVTEVVTAMMASDHPAPRARLSVILRMNRHRLDPEPVADIVELLAGMQGKESLAPCPDAVEALGDLDTVLRAWPEEEQAAEALSEARRELHGQVAAHAARVRMLAASAGAAPEQLAALGEPDAATLAELGLVAREMAWQLRLLVRQARRGWALGPGEAAPDWLTGWCREADERVARHLGGAADETADETAGPAD